MLSSSTKTDWRIDDIIDLRIVFVGERLRTKRVY